MVARRFRSRHRAVFHAAVGGAAAHRRHRRGGGGRHRPHRPRYRRAVAGVRRGARRAGNRHRRLSQRRRRPPGAARPLRRCRRRTGRGRRGALGARAGPLHPRPRRPRPAAARAPQLEGERGPRRPRPRRAGQRARHAAAAARAELPGRVRLCADLVVHADRRDRLSAGFGDRHPPGPAAVGRRGLARRCPQPVDATDRGPAAGGRRRHRRGLRHRRSGADIARHHPRHALVGDGPPAVDLGRPHRHRRRRHDVADAGAAVSVAVDRAPLAGQDDRRRCRCRCGHRLYHSCRRTGADGALVRRHGAGPARHRARARGAVAPATGGRRLHHHGDPARGVARPQLSADLRRRHRAGGAVQFAVRSLADLAAAGRFVAVANRPASGGAAGNRGHRRSAAVGDRAVPFQCDRHLRCVGQSAGDSLD